MRPYIFLTILLLSTATAAGAENKAYLKDGNIQVQTGEKVHTLDYTKQRHDPYNLKKYTISEEIIDPVEEALEVYKQKGQPSYERRLRIVDRSDPNKIVVIDDFGGDYNKVHFTPDEDFVYYLGKTGLGSSAYSIYGYNLGSNEKFLVAPGNNYQVENCPDKKSYVVVKVTGKETSYIIYDTYGKKVKDLYDVASPADLNKFVCY